METWLLLTACRKSLISHLSCTV